MQNKNKNRDLPKKNSNMDFYILSNKAPKNKNSKGLSKQNEMTDMTESIKKKENTTDFASLMEQMKEEKQKFYAKLNSLTLKKKKHLLMFQSL